MSEEAKFRKEVQGRKKEYAGKKIELISRLCSEETPKKENKDVKSLK